MEPPGATPTLFVQEPYLNKKLTREEFEVFMKIKNHELALESINWLEAEPLVFATLEGASNQRAQ